MHNEDIAVNLVPRALPFHQFLLQFQELRLNFSDYELGLHEFKKLPNPSRMGENGCSPLQRMEQVAGGEEEPDGARGGADRRRGGGGGSGERRLGWSSGEDGEERRRVRRGAAARGQAGGGVCAVARSAVR